MLELLFLMKSLQGPMKESFRELLYLTHGPTVDTVFNVSPTKSALNRQGSNF